MKIPILLGKKAAILKLIAPNNAPPMHNDRHPHISINPATNTPTNCVTPYKTAMNIICFFINQSLGRFNFKNNKLSIIVIIPDPIIEMVTWSELNSSMR